MLRTNTSLKSGWGSRLFWGISFKNRRILIPVLILMIIGASVFLLQRFYTMDIKLKRLARYEPIYVLAINRDLNIGDLIHESDLKPFLIYKKEFTEMVYRDSNNLTKPSLIAVSYNSSTGKLEGFSNVIGRVVKLPIYKNSLLRQEHLSSPGTLPGLINLIDEDQALVDIEVPQHGFNVFIKPNDYVDLHALNRDNAELIASKVKVILVDSQALGQAPMNVSIDEKSTRHLTLAVSEANFPAVVKAKKNRSLMLTYKNKEPELIYTDKKIYRPKPKVLKNPFQTLVMIHGAEREIVNR